MYGMVSLQGASAGSRPDHRPHHPCFLAMKQAWPMLMGHFFAFSNSLPAGCGIPGYHDLEPDVLIPDALSTLHPLYP